MIQSVIDSLCSHVSPARQPRSSLSEAEQLAELKVHSSSLMCQSRLSNLKETFRFPVQVLRHYSKSFLLTTLAIVSFLQCNRSIMATARSASSNGTMVVMNAWIDPANTERFLKLSESVSAEFRKHPENLFVAICVNPTDQGHIRIVHGWTKASERWYEARESLLSYKLEAELAGRLF